MSAAVAFTTPGLIDLMAFTTFGINAKPATNNPIGYFGTGLKYAIAVLVREGATPVLWIGRNKYSFYAKPTKFRDKTFPMVRMKREGISWLRPSHHALPFSTELGKNWKIWQAFRELESNTRDENGVTTLLGADDANEAKESGGIAGYTEIIVQHDEFVRAYLDRDDVFLPGGLTVREEGPRVQVLDKPSKSVFYRGLRVADLDKTPALFTYNFLSPIDLTEDRTLKYTSQAHAELARHIVTSQDEAFIEKVLTAPDTTWEGSIQYDYQNEAPSDAFRNVVERRKGAVGRSALRYYGGWDRPSPAPIGTWDKYPRPWKAYDDRIEDFNGTSILMGMDNASSDKQLYIDVVDAINSAGDSS